ncbi:Mdm33 family-domain-containing protein [Emericellopsis atlantica]|uniref:Sensitive to high expression protein 9, mitochondrial n=1 Tax=Emericellopsis atlantica TaxID=2614577 RepID=A0A9P7ZGY9_9HYPO|nr:Mdm33 family-domain-containing protein [Emericellopsis atlantica]KAG9251929.1 Mdm33 family-domain-containing protein [Emericellopsis atlantica]
MQSLGRPVARTVLGAARQLHGRPLWPGARLWTEQSHERWRSRQLTVPLRCYATFPKDENKNATTEKPADSITDETPSNRISASESGADFANGGTREQAENSSIHGQEPTVNDRTLPSSKVFQNSLKEKFSVVMDDLQARALNASQTLNDLTGYSAIESIKAENTALEDALAKAHAHLTASRSQYKSSNSKRAATQREVTTLLARKESWSPTDLERFTELYRTDHVLEGEVAAAQEALTEAEAEEQRLSQKLNAGILKRYHEEQIWSDRIRRASTWGTWGLMGMNFLLFVVLQFVAEPWKRRRLVNGVVAEEKQVLEEVRGELAAVKLALEAAAAKSQELDEPVLGMMEAVSGEPVTTAEPTTTLPALLEEHVSAPEPAITWKQFLSETERWQIAMKDLYSDRRLELRMKDASALALEGAAAGAAIAGAVFWMMARR